MDANDEQRFKRRLIGNLALAGTYRWKLSGKQEMKLREWIVPYLATEFELSTEPLVLPEIKKYIDEWEHADLSPEAYRHYYVTKGAREHLSRWFHP